MKSIAKVLQLNFHCNRKIDFQNHLKVFPKSFIKDIAEIPTFEIRPWNGITNILKS